MEKRISKKIETHVTQFKDDLREKLMKLNLENSEMVQLIEYIYEYPRLVINKEDLVKRKRIKNSIPGLNRCSAKRADGDQCTRRRKDECDYCGTHVKGTPHGLVTNDIPEIEQDKRVEVYAKEINGIVYHLDNFCNVYKTEDIMKEEKNPEIIYKYQVNDGVYRIVESII
jgi:hypothetical protein|uniref:Uncharacterized protein n=1 Tax=viral metagenome TaxID=1070528 RepID=A0A6C0IMD4_9ZZZZ